MPFYMQIQHLVIGHQKIKVPIIQDMKLPRGPNQKVSEGIIKIAKTAKVPIIPIGIASSSFYDVDVDVSESTESQRKAASKNLLDLLALGYEYYW